jgi:hypothetical protein
MADRKAPGPVEQSIARLRELRYQTRGAGAKSKAPSLTAKRIEQLQGMIDAVPPTKSRAEKKAAKQKKGKRR